MPETDVTLQLIMMQLYHTIFALFHNNKSSETVTLTALESFYENGHKLVRDN